MSPRAGSSAANGQPNNARNVPSPYARRPSGQPKSSRQQFSACGACRMRRVRCDLKDLPIATAGPNPACSNCKERGLKCVDEFADVKAVKLLRRGRRLQQVEVYPSRAIYGKASAPDSSLSSPPATRLPSIIPQLKAEFFASPFWHWFSIQRNATIYPVLRHPEMLIFFPLGPVLDHAEFPARFLAHLKGIQSLGHEGGLIAMILVVWAASFGIDERGLPEAQDPGVAETQPMSDAESNSKTARKSPEKRTKTVEYKRKEKKDRAEAMLREVLELIDFHGVMRRPTWDGVRALLLVLPLLEDAHPLERLAISEAALSHTQALCTLAVSSPGPSSSLHSLATASDDAIVHARVFWYAYLQEGIATGMRGGRLVMDNDDFDVFQRTITPFLENAQSGLAQSSSLSTFVPHSLESKSRRDVSHNSLHISQLFSVPLQLSAVCRKVHNVLTGPKATRRAELHGLIDAHGMREIWEDLNHCWEEFGLLRDSANSFDPLDVDQFVSAWQIFIFECHNIIRESLKQCISNASTGDSSNHSTFSASPPRPSSHSSTSSPYLPPQQLHIIATRQCLRLLPAVLHVIDRHLAMANQTPDGAGLFRWDAGLVRDGCFFAGFLAASSYDDTIDPSPDDDKNSGRVRSRLGVEDAVSTCLSALAEMRWAFSKSEEREETVRMVWENRKLSRQEHYDPTDIDLGRTHSHTYGDDRYTAMPRPTSLPSHPESHGFLTAPIHDRPLLPPLNLLRSPRRVESAPNTACSVDNRGTNGWPSYTPPGTATSVTTSAGTGLSARGSPVFSAMAGSMGYKGDVHDNFYHMPSDLDHFSFNAPVTTAALQDVPTLGGLQAYSQRHHPATSVHGPAYLEPDVYDSPHHSLTHTSNEIGPCPQFGEDGHAFYR